MVLPFEKGRDTRQLNAAIGAILDIPPLRTEPTPWCMAGTVAKGDVAMYLFALEFFYLSSGAARSP